MNNRFKFRFWDKEDCSYFEPQTFDEVWFDKDGGLHIGCYSDFTQDIEDYRNEVIIEQCTGLKDKNGNLIYEGDIVKDEFGRKFKIIWSEEDCMFDGRTIYYDPEFGDRFDLYQTAIDNSEIIGNIHTRNEK